VTFSKPTRLALSAVHSALHLSGMSVSLDEAECLVAGMIYKGYIRGYISHEKRMVVLANVNAFPRICERGPGVWAEL
jgi:COP9 signalosome complex subunit 12